MVSSFLLVSLNIGAILDEITLHQRRKKLEEMTKEGGLDDAYAAILSQVKAQERSRSKLGMEVLMWVSHSERPLHVDELCHALGVEEGSTDLSIGGHKWAMDIILLYHTKLVKQNPSNNTITGKKKGG